MGKKHVIRSILELKFSLQLLHCPILTLVPANHINHKRFPSSEMQGAVRVHIIMCFLLLSTTTIHHNSLQPQQSTTTASLSLVHVTCQTSPLTEFDQKSLPWSKFSSLLPFGVSNQQSNLLVVLGCYSMFLGAKSVLC